MTKQKALESNLINVVVLGSVYTVYLVVHLGWPAQGYYDACGFCFYLQILQAHCKVLYRRKQQCILWSRAQTLKLVCDKTRAHRNLFYVLL